MVVRIFCSYLPLFSSYREREEEGAYGKIKIWSKRVGEGRGEGFITYTDSDGATFTRLLARQGMGSTEIVAPVSSSDGDDRKLGDNDGCADGSGDFLGSLDAQTDVTLRVTDDDNSLESGSLTGTRLLLHRLDL